MFNPQPYLLAFLSYIFTVYILHRLTRNYLSLRSLRIPGPLQAKTSSKWLLSKYVTGDAMNTVHALHRKYGSVVQVGPKEISFATATAREAIYEMNTLTFKSKVYDTFGPPSLFTFRDKETHRERKKRIQHIFAPTALRDVEPTIHSEISKFLHLLRKKAGQSWDVVKPTHMLTLDIGGEVLLGKSFGAQGSLEGSETPYFLQVMPFVHPMFALTRELPWLVTILKKLPFKWSKDFTGSVSYVYGYGAQCMRESVEKYGRNAGRRDLLTKLIAGDPAKGTLPLPDKDIGYEVGNFIYAATDTTAIVMSYLMFELASNPDWQNRVRYELRDAKAKEQGYIYQVLQGLPILQACVHESMRLHPGIGPGLPRVTPSEGMEIDGMWIPGDTAVSVPMHTLQRDSSVFPDPDTFNPDRWLTVPAYLPTMTVLYGPLDPSFNSPLDSPPIPNSCYTPIFTSTPEQSAHWFLWGGGEYTCAGQHMALMEIKILIARILDEFEVCVMKEDKAGWEMCDHFVVATKGGKGKLVFRSLTEEMDLIS